MDISVNNETKAKDSILDVIKSFFATSKDNEEEIDRKVKEIERQEDGNNIASLKKMVETPKAVKSKINRRNINTKKQNNKTNVKSIETNVQTVEEKVQDEKEQDEKV